jgi:hypothetical protein
MAAAAFYRYASSAADKARIGPIIRNYARFCREQYMINEPYSWIYGAWIVMAWLSIYMTAKTRHEDADIAAEYRKLIEQFLAIGYMMKARAEFIAPYSGAPSEKDKLPRDVYVMCGARSWGHATTAELGFYGILDVAFFNKKPKKYNSSWTSVALQDDIVCLELRLLWHAMNKDMLWERYINYPAKVAIQLIGTDRGDRVFIMGQDETDDVDDDPNSNTPGVLYFGVVNKTIRMAPGHPNPPDGLVRLRQKNVVADIDGTPSHGWTIISSHLGAEKLAPGKYFTMIPAIDHASSFRLSIFPDGRKVDYIMDVDPPPPPIVVKPKSKWQKFLDWF